MTATMSGLLRLSALRPLHRIFQTPPRHSSGATTPSDSTTTTAISVPAPVDRIRQRNFSLLYESLEIDGNPSRVWANYTNLLTFLGYEQLPLEIHQQVLRKCTPSSRLLRASATRRLFLGNVPRTPHLYEGRLQTVVRNIRALGVQPTLDDYNFILEQFAVVGHHFGVMQVYKELTSFGITPRTKTFGLCLQAIAHRLTLPVALRDKDRRILVTRRMVSELVSAMKSLNIPFTSVNLDLTMRILKETTDMQGFEMLMKWGYGIDLANPDCPPLEYLAYPTDASSGVKAPIPQPFSTAALNMTIDTLGRLGNISRMVQAFEVLTAPLPQHSPNATSTSYNDEEDEDDFGVSVEPPPPPFTPPSARPNTTTYNLLLRHVSRAGHAVFARHYLVQAMRLEKEVFLTLRRDFGRLPLQDVPAPHFSINRGTLLSVFGQSNRDKNLGLMRWLSLKLNQILKRKRNALNYYSDHRAARQRKRLWPYNDPSRSTDTLPMLPVTPRKSAIPPTPLSRGSSRFTTIMQRWRAPQGVGEVFDVDVEDESSQLPTPVKNFNLDLHIRVLTRDIAEIEALQDHVRMVFARTTRRVKERLGRRVWRGKDIYLLTDGDRRRRISMGEWENIARVRKEKTHRPYIFPWSDPVNRQRAPAPHLNLDKAEPENVGKWVQAR
ncbi:hypothetical protein B0H16DRAFT_1447890 [Mycena metata]|uniref:Uncharacterized protein n=1 Tax=Mycena metata TaxID=1033252 RepID=A0AAD7KAC7_9AGAR|nr:hypothetical protein B0H16DRAFT_1447890 [Mycena metata]